MDQTRTTPAPEFDDTDNPTAAAPENVPDEEVIQMPGPETIEEPAPFDEPAETSAGANLGADLGGDQNSSRRPDVQQMVGQLQHMIDQLATQASPALKEVAAKAAELAAAAGNRAGPIAHKAADVTGSVGQRVADRSGQMAASLRGSRRPGTADDAVSSDPGKDEAVGE